MRKLFTIATALLVGSVGMAQTSSKTRVVRPEQAISSIPSPQEEAFAPLMMRQGNGVQSTTPPFSTDQVTSIQIGSSGNFFGYSNPSQKQLSIMNDLNSAAFIFRNNPAASGAGNSGHLRYNISSNKGASWAVNAQPGASNAGIGNINPTQPKLARYPACVLFTDPATGGATTNARLGALAPALNSSGTGWEGFSKIVVGPNIFTNLTTPVVEQEDYALLEGPVFAQHITERVPGEFWATMYSDNTANDTMYVLKGHYDATAQSILWAYQDKLMPAWNTAANGGSAVWLYPKIEFSPNGQIGYVSVMGDLVGGLDSTIIPILWDYNATTGHFDGTAYEIDLTQFPQLMDFIHSVVDTSGANLNRGIATCQGNYDLSVDFKGNAHILSILTPCGSGDLTTAPSAYTYYRYAMQVMDITKDYTGSWNMIKIWDQQTLTEDLSGGSSPITNFGTSAHLSRTEDGKYIFYTWSDTDTTGHPALDNDEPNMKGCFYDATTDMISVVKDWTFDDQVWVGQARCPKTANRVFESGTSCPGRTFKVPTTVASIPAYPDPGTVSDFFYFSDINYDCSDANQTPSWYHTCAMSPIYANPTMVEPACGQSNGSITINPAGGVGNFSTVIMNSAGSVVSTNGSASNLAAGPYLVMVMDSFGCSMDSIVNLVNAGAAVGFISNPTAPTCSNTTNGSLTICWTGGTGAVNVTWYDGNGNPISGGVTTGTCNTNASLPSGTIVAVLSDANGCISTASTTLGAGTALSMVSSYADVTCKDSANGSISVVLNGGSGTPTYVWTGPGSVSGNTTSVAEDLIPGTYTITISSNGCSVADTFAVAEPAAQLVATLNPTATTTCNPYNGSACVIDITGGNQPSSYTYSWYGTSGGSAYPVSPGDQDCASALPGGTYTVVVTDSKGCTSTQTVTVEGCQVGIEHSLGNVNAFKAYPNPASHILNVQMTLTKADDVQISLVNVAGQTIMSRNVAKSSNVNEQFNVANVAKGIYFLKVTTAEGSAADKIVIE